MSYEIVEWKEMPIMVIQEGENMRTPFRFGLKKAALIVKYIEEIKGFLKANEGRKESTHVANNKD